MRTVVAVAYLPKPAKGADGALFSSLRRRSSR
jgi:hypothetical protein